MELLGLFLQDKDFFLKLVEVKRRGGSVCRFCFLLLKTSYHELVVITNSEEKMVTQYLIHDKLLRFLKDSIIEKLIDNYAGDFIKEIIFSDENYSILQPFIYDVLSLLQQYYTQEFCQEMNIFIEKCKSLQNFEHILNFFEILLKEDNNKCAFKEQRIVIRSQQPQIDSNIDDDVRPLDTEQSHIKGQIISKLQLSIIQENYDQFQHDEKLQIAYMFYVLFEVPVYIETAEYYKILEQEISDQVECVKIYCLEQLAKIIDFHYHNTGELYLFVLIYLFFLTVQSQKVLQKILNVDYNFFSGHILILSQRNMGDIAFIMNNLFINQSDISMDRTFILKSFQRALQRSNFEYKSKIINNIIQVMIEIFESELRMDEKVQNSQSDIKKQLKFSDDIAQFSNNNNNSTFNNTGVSNMLALQNNNDKNDDIKIRDSNINDTNKIDDRKRIDKKHDDVLDSSTDDARIFKVVESLNKQYNLNIHTNEYADNDNKQKNIQIDPGIEKDITQPPLMMTQQVSTPHNKHTQPILNPTQLNDNGTKNLSQQIFNINQLNNSQEDDPVYSSQYKLLLRKEQGYLQTDINFFKYAKNSALFNFLFNLTEGVNLSGVTIDARAVFGLLKYFLNSKLQDKDKFYSIGQALQIITQTQNFQNKEYAEIALEASLQLLQSDRYPEDQGSEVVKQTKMQNLQMCLLVFKREDVKQLIMQGIRQKQILYVIITMFKSNLDSDIQTYIKECFFEIFVTQNNIQIILKDISNTLSKAEYTQSKVTQIEKDMQFICTCLEIFQNQSKVNQAVLAELLNILKRFIIYQEEYLVTNKQLTQKPQDIKLPLNPQIHSTLANYFVKNVLQVLHQQYLEEKQALMKLLVVNSQGIVDTQDNSLKFVIKIIQTFDEQCKDLSVVLLILAGQSDKKKFIEILLQTLKLSDKYVPVQLQEAGEDQVDYQDSIQIDLQAKEIQQNKSLFRYLIPVFQNLGMNDQDILQILTQQINRTSSRHLQSILLQDFVEFLDLQQFSLASSVLSVLSSLQEDQIEQLSQEIAQMQPQSGQGFKARFFHLDGNWQFECLAQIFSKITSRELLESLVECLLTMLRNSDKQLNVRECVVIRVLVETLTQEIVQIGELKDDGQGMLNKKQKKRRKLQESRQEQLMALLGNLLNRLLQICQHNKVVCIQNIVNSSKKSKNNAKLGLHKLLQAITDKIDYIVFLEIAISLLNKPIRIELELQLLDLIIRKLVTIDKQDIQQIAKGTSEYQQNLKQQLLAIFSGLLEILTKRYQQIVLKRDVSTGIQITYSQFIFVGLHAILKIGQYFQVVLFKFQTELFELLPSYTLFQDVQVDKKMSIWGSMLLTFSQILVVLERSATQFLPKVLPYLFEIIEAMMLQLKASEDSASNLKFKELQVVTTSIILKSINNILRSQKAMVGEQYLKSSLHLVLMNESFMRSEVCSISQQQLFIDTLVESLPLDMQMQVVRNVFKGLKPGTNIHTVQFITRYLKTLVGKLDAVDSGIYSQLLLQLVLDNVQYTDMYNDSETIRDNIEVLGVLAMSLTDQNIRSLLQSFLDWTNCIHSEGLPKGSRDYTNRQMFLFLTLINWLKNLKSIFTPYYALAFQVIQQNLQTSPIQHQINAQENAISHQNKSQNQWLQLQLAVLQSISLCFSFDEGEVVKNEEFRNSIFESTLSLIQEEISQSMVRDLECYQKLYSLQNKSKKGIKASRRINVFYSQIVNTVISIAFGNQSTADDRWKKMNYRIMLITREGQGKSKVAALEIVSQLIKRLKGEYIEVMPETAPFLSELFEDPDQEVVMAAQSVIQELGKFTEHGLDQYFNQ